MSRHQRFNFRCPCILVTLSGTLLFFGVCFLLRLMLHCAPAAPREAPAPAAVLSKTGLSKERLQGGGGNQPAEDEPGMLSPAGLPPTALVNLERSGIGSSAAKESVVLQQHTVTNTSSTNPYAGSLSIVGSSQVVPIILTDTLFPSRASLSTTGQSWCSMFQVET
jgi:hypothetical protein